jgi:hydroxyacylglutathione hydrolase
MTILDTRPFDDLFEGFIPGSIYAPINTITQLIAMGVIELDTPIQVLALSENEKEVDAFFKKMGFTQYKGLVEGGWDKWSSENDAFDILIDVEVDELAMDLPFDKYLMIVDTREDAEYHEAHIENSFHYPLSEITDPGSMSEFDEHFNLYIIGKNNTDMAICATILKKQGFHNQRIVINGWDAVQSLKDKFTLASTPPEQRITPQEN